MPESFGYGVDPDMNSVMPETTEGSPAASPAAVPHAAIPHASLGAGAIEVAGTTFVADLSGAIYWPEEHLLAVADLHLEKGSAFAARGMLVPPYDTVATLERIAALLDRYAVRTVVALGDNFHDGGGPGRLAAADRATLRELQRGRDWVWIAGNHDPEPPADVGGVAARSLALGPLTFRHEPAGDLGGEIAGHLHPSARVYWRGRTMVRRCFASDRQRLVMPAFGTYTGGLNIRHRAFLNVFGALGFTAHLIGRQRLYAFAAARCLAE
jgi:DNA ligase-associated metallophosphoesterase